MIFQPLELINGPLMGFPGAQLVNNLPAMPETWVQSLCQKGPLEKGMATQYSCLENPMYRGTWRATVHGVAESDMTERLTLPLSHNCPTLSKKENPKV